MTAPTWGEEQVAAAQQAISGHLQALKLEPDTGDATELFHLLLSLLEWSDANGVDFDMTLEEARGYFVSDQK